VNVRFADHAVRVRLTEVDVEALAETGEVGCAVHFPNGTRWRCLVSVAMQHAPTATYAAGQLSIVMPAHEFDRWRAIDDEDVAERMLRVTLPAGSHRLTLIVEQDLHSTPERS
jgi:hypothetical protein